MIRDRDEVFARGNELLRQMALRTLRDGRIEHLTEYQRGLIPTELAAYEKRAATERKEREALAAAAAQAQATVDKEAARVATNRRRIAGAIPIDYHDARVAAMVERVFSLVQDHDVTVQFASHGEQHAVMSKREIHIAPVTNAGTFVAALHELAHVVSVKADSRQWRYVCLKDSRSSPSAETWAWRQAMTWAAELWTREVFVEAARALDTYRRVATEAERVEMRAFIREAAAAVSDGPVQPDVLREITSRFEEPGPLIDWVEPGSSDGAAVFEEALTDTVKRYRGPS